MSLQLVILWNAFTEPHYSSQYLSTNPLFWGSSCGKLLADFIARYAYDSTFAMSQLLINFAGFFSPGSKYGTVLRSARPFAAIVGACVSQIIPLAPRSVFCRSQRHPVVNSRSEHSFTNAL